jgi:glycosyltransferase involved in cell wall biosynthesis
MNKQPIVMISSYSPRLCGIATFCEEAREFIQKTNPDREVLVISHTDGEGEGVFPIIDMTKRYWWKPVAEKIYKLKPYAVHIEHEYGLYEYRNNKRIGDGNKGFIDLLEAIKDHPTVVEPHTIHGRLTEFEMKFVSQMCQMADIVFVKCHYQRWRLGWTFPKQGFDTPTNVMVIPHGARPDKRVSPDDVPKLRAELGLDKITNLKKHIVGLVGWIQANKRWDILTSIWEEILEEIDNKCNKCDDRNWSLLAAGIVRGDPIDQQHYKKYMKGINELQKKGLAHFHEFEPRGDLYYKVMAVCDFVVLPSVDETQSGTLARIIALNKPFITIAPMEGLTAQTIESKGGLLFTTPENLREKVVDLACNENRRIKLGNNLENYLKNVVSWEIIGKQYNEAYRLARKAKRTGKKVKIKPEF